MTAEKEILTRLERIESLLARLLPEQQDVRHEIRVVRSQGRDVVGHFKEKFKSSRRPNK